MTVFTTEKGLENLRKEAEHVRALADELVGTGATLSRVTSELRARGDRTNLQRLMVAAAKVASAREELELEVDDLTRQAER